MFGTSVLMVTPSPELSMSILILFVSSSDDVRIMARIATSPALPECTFTAPNAFSMETFPPVKRTVLLTERSKRVSAAYSVTVTPRSSATAKRLRIRNMVSLSEHVLQRLLFLAVHGEQLLADLCIVSVLIDVGLALGDGIVEQHQFFLVADENRRLWLVELRRGEFFEFVDCSDVCFFRAFHVVERSGAEDRLVECFFVRGADAHRVEGACTEADRHDDRRGDAHPLMGGFQRSLD